MTRYAALLRGVSPQNLKMSDFAACLTSARLTKVKTVISSGNAVFECAARDEAPLERVSSGR